jgi:diguanylate cyclase (GGDEF)-like protein
MSRFAQFRLSTRTHLGLLLVGPMMLVIGTSLERAQASRETRDQALLLVGESDAVGRLFAAASALRKENTITVVDMTARDLGLPIEFVSDLVGFDVTDELAVTRAQTDNVFVEVDELLPAMSGTISAARRAADTSASIERVPLIPVYQQIQGLITTRLDRLQVDAAGLTNNERFGRSIDTLRLALRAGTAAQDQESAVGNLVVNPSGLTERHLITDMTIATHKLVEATSLLAAMSGPVGTRTAEILADDAFARLSVAGEEQTERRLTEQANGDPTVLAPVIADSTIRGDLMVELVRLADDDVDREIAVIAATARDRAEQDITLALITIVVTLASAFLVGRRLTKPLRRLRREAQRLIEGGGAETIRVSGPSEVAVSVQAFNELVNVIANVDRQTEALSRGDLDHPCLGVPVAGRIGYSVQQAVHRLTRSMTEERSLRAILRHDATHDRLTGCLNRSGIFEELRSRLSAAPVGVRALVFVDLDGFKAVNDLYGHAAGDVVLAETARRIAAVADVIHPAARLGGDEFVVVIDAAVTLEAASTIADQILHAIAEPIDLGDSGTVSITASVGVAEVSADEDVSALLHAADIAVYRAKSAGRARVEVFDDAVRADLAHADRIEAEVRDAIEADEFVRYLQPVIDAHTGELAVCEALIRWPRPDGTVRNPADFMPVAERSPLIIELDLAGVRWAVDQIVHWRQFRQLHAVRLAVNLSVRTIQHWDVVRRIEAELSRSGIDPSLLAVEVTETMLVDDAIALHTNLDRLSALGVVVAIDDFGTGNTSINQLLSIQANAIKLDRSLVTRLNDPSGESVVRAVVDLAHAAAARVTAEGIEDQATMQSLVELGVDYLQGFHIARPMPADEVVDWLARRQPYCRNDVSQSASPEPVG